MLALSTAPSVAATRRESLLKRSTHFVLVSMIAWLGIIPLEPPMFHKIVMFLNSLLSLWQAVAVSSISLVRHRKSNLRQHDDSASLALL